MDLAVQLRRKRDRNGGGPGEQDGPNPEHGLDTHCSGPRASGKTGRRRDPEDEDPVAGLTGCNRS